MKAAIQIPLHLLWLFETTCQSRKTQNEYSPPGHHKYIANIVIIGLISIRQQLFVILFVSFFRFSACLYYLNATYHPCHPERSEAFCPERSRRGSEGSAISSILRYCFLVNTNKFYFIGLFNLTRIMYVVKKLLVNMEKW